jgi:hypothetical protein
VVRVRAGVSPEHALPTRGNALIGTRVIRARGKQQPQNNERLRHGDLHSNATERSTYSRRSDQLGTIEASREHDFGWIF